MASTHPHLASGAMLPSCTIFAARRVVPYKLSNIHGILRAALTAHHKSPVAVFSWRRANYGPIAKYIARRKIWESTAFYHQTSSNSRLRRRPFRFPLFMCSIR